MSAPTEKTRLLEIPKIVVKLECPRCSRKLEIEYDLSKFPFENLRIEKCFPKTNGEHHVLADSTQNRKRGYRIRLTKGCYRYLFI